MESSSPLISEQLACCMKLFRQLVFSGSDGVVPTVLWEDAFGKLKIWAANIGALGTGAASLDHRLRDASHMREQVSRVLRAIQQNLEDLQSTSDDRAKDARTEAAFGEDSAEDPFGSDSELDTSIPEQQQIYSTVQELIGCLFSLSMVIRRPAQRDRFQDSGKEDSGGYERFDLQHVLNKYPQIDPSVGARLAGAITRRRRELKYFKRHRAKLGRDIEDEEDRTGRTVLSSTIASKYNDSDPNLSSTASIMTDLSATSYSSSLFDSDTHLTVPSPPPESANGAPFECPYCKYIVTVKGSRTWARHVFTDLRPYLCVFHDCEMPGRLYETRRDLVKHLLEHMTAEQALNWRCPLCGIEDMRSQTMGDHLGRHLEELALFALPRFEGPEENDRLHQVGDICEGSDQSDDEKLSDSGLDDANPEQPLEVDQNEQGLGEMNEDDSRVSYISEFTSIYNQGLAAASQTWFPEIDGAPEAIHMGHTKTDLSFVLMFLPHAIGKGRVKIKHIRVSAAQRLHVPPLQLQMFYEGRELVQDRSAAREYGNEKNSPISFNVTFHEAHLSNENSASVNMDDPDNSDDPILRKAEMPLIVRVEPSAEVSVAKEETSFHSESTLGRLDALLDKLQNIWVPQCNRFIAAPPSDINARMEDYQRLWDSVHTQIVLTAESIEIGTDDVARGARQQLILEARDTLRALKESLLTLGRNKVSMAT